MVLLLFDRLQKIYMYFYLHIPDNIFRRCCVVLMLSWGLCLVAFGQAMMGPYWLYDNHYLTDKYLINPAFAGNQYYPKVFVSSQRLEVVLRDAPTLHIAGGHGRLDFNRKRYGAVEARNAMGGLLFTDNNGLYQSVGFKLDYAYYVPLNQKNSTLSFGLGGMLLSKRVRTDKYDLSAINDPLIAASLGNNVTIPDFNAGVLLSHNKLYVGFSVSHLLENSYQFSTFNYTPAQVFRNYYLLTGYRFEYRGFELEPSITAGYNLATGSYSNIGNFVDLNIECFLKPVVVFTLSYRIDGFFNFSLLYRNENLELGIRTELFSTNPSDANFVGVCLMASYLITIN